MGGSSTRPTPLQIHLAVSRHILFPLCFAWPEPANADCYQLLKQQCPPCGKILQIHKLDKAFTGLIGETECPMPAVICLLLRLPNQGLLAFSSLTIASRHISRSDPFIRWRMRCVRNTFPLLTMSSVGINWPRLWGLHHFMKTNSNFMDGV